jgi:ribosomal protein L4
MLLSARNLSKVRVSLADHVNLYDIANANHLLLVEEALPLLEKHVLYESNA